jgi:hypothetical protein
MRHQIKHHVNRPVLHLGMFTDAQMLPAAGMLAVAAGWVYAGAGGLVARVVVAVVALLPAGVMVVDNRVGGIVADQVRAFIRWHRQPGIFAPGVEDARGYALAPDDEHRLALMRERLGRVDLEAAFAEDS